MWKWLGGRCDLDRREVFLVCILPTKIRDSSAYQTHVTIILFRLSDDGMWQNARLFAVTVVLV